MALISSKDGAEVAGPSVVVETLVVNNGTGIHIDLGAERFDAIWMLPSYTDFVGREVELARLGAALEEESPQPVVLYGASGLGKTCLAVEYARRFKQRYPAGALLIKCRELPPADLMSAAARMNLVRQEGYETVDEFRRRTLDELARRRALLILDDANPDEAIQSWIPWKGSACHVIVTSTGRLWPNHLNILHVPPFGDEDAKALIAQIVKDGSVVKKWAPALIDRAGGVTVELCALASNAHYLAMANRSVQIREGLSDKTKSSFEGPWRGLSKDAQILLRVVCMYEPGDLLETELTELLSSFGWERDRVLRAVDETWNRMLLGKDDEMLRTHRLMVEFVRKKIEPKLPEGIERKHRDRFLQAAKAFVENPTGELENKRFSAFSPTMAYQKEEMEVAVPETRWRDCRAANALRRGSYGYRTAPWYRPPIGPSSIDQLAGPRDYITMGNFFLDMGIRHFKAGSIASAREWFTCAIKAERNTKGRGRIDHEVWGNSLHDLGCCYIFECQYARARESFEQAAELKGKGDGEARRDHQSIGESLHQLGFCYAEEGRFDKARVWFARAVEAKDKGNAQGSVNHESVGKSLHQVGVCDVKAGKHEGSLRWFERAAEAKMKGDIHGRIDGESLGKSLYRIGVYHFRKRMYAAALSWFDKSVRAKRGGDLRGRVDERSLVCSQEALAFTQTKLNHT